MRTERRHYLRNRAHEKFIGLPKEHRRILGKYFRRQKELSIEDRPRLTERDQILSEAGRRILWYINDVGPLPEISDLNLGDLQEV